MNIKEVAPTIDGRHGKAWLLDLDALRERDDANPEDCTLMSYIVNAPWAHPMWPNYQMCVITLADKPGVRPATIRKPGATHEIMVMALNPNHTPETDGPPHCLFPLNFVGQYIAEDDSQACEVLTDTVRAVIDGRLSPEGLRRGYGKVSKLRLSFCYMG